LARGASGHNHGSQFWQLRPKPVRQTTDVFRQLFLRNSPF
jgi:hypothetical protein